MKLFKFDCTTNNAPAYICSEPNDNSGHYYRAEDVDELLRKTQQIELMSNKDIKDAIENTISMLKGSPPSNEVMVMLENHLERMLDAQYSRTNIEGE